ncbi:MAG: acyl-CoA dehydrogenase family protein [Ilumatobacteraceae bacterium]
MTRSLSDIALDADTRSAEIDELRRLPTDLVADLAATGVFKRWVPKDYGGDQAAMTEGLCDIETTARANGSVGWCVMIAMTTGLTAALLPAEHADAVFGAPDAITGGFAMPAGTGTVGERGIRATGRWSWGSGTDHCTSIGGGLRLVDASGEPFRRGSGTVFAFFDRDDVELLDTWRVGGLRGTASNDYTVTDAFVPEGRWIDVVTRPEPIVDDPLYRFSFFGALAAGVASVLLGLGRRAIDELIALGEKVPVGGSRSLANRPVVQASLAEADAAVRSARAFLHSTVTECWDSVAAGGTVTDEERRLLRLAATNAAERCAHAVDLCHRAAGGTSVFETSPLLRVFRDTHVATQHGMVAPATNEVTGRMAFGLPTMTFTL